MAKRKTKKQASKPASRPPYTRGNHLEWLKNWGQLPLCWFRSGAQNCRLFAELEGQNDTVSCRDGVCKTALARLCSIW